MMQTFETFNVTDIWNYFLSITFYKHLLSCSTSSQNASLTDENDLLYLIQGGALACANCKEEETGPTKCSGCDKAFTQGQ